MKSNWFKGIWVVLLIGFFMQCEVANNSSTQETANETEQIKQQFNLKLFEDALPQNSSVNWASPNKTYSEKLKSMYVEFPITYDKISASGSGTTKTPPQYSIIAVREASGYKFYLAKFLSNTSISENQNVMLSNADSFTGIAMLLNRDLEAEHVFGLDKGKIKATGSQISKESYKEIKSGKLKMSVDCYTEVVHHYTDWYQEYSDGTVAYIYTEYNGSTETQVCYDDPPTGSGGGGGGSGSTYDETIDKKVFFLGSIIKDASLSNNQKANCVYNKLAQTKTMQNVIGAFSGENTNYDLVFKVDNIGVGLLGATSKTPNSNNEFTIIINEYYIPSNAALDIARTFLHEAIHAELSQKVASVGGSHNLSGDNFPAIYEYYRNYQDWSHEQMADHYRNTIINGMKEFDQNAHANSFYDALSWRGLEGTTSWQSKSSQEQTNIRAVYQNLLQEQGSTQCQ